MHLKYPVGAPRVKKGDETIENVPDSREAPVMKSDAARCARFPLAFFVKKENNRAYEEHQ
jgi:hypothetical protein